MELYTSFMDDMKHILTVTLSAVREILKQQKRNAGWYSAEVAAEQNGELDTRRRAYQQECGDKITEIATKAVENAAELSRFSLMEMDEPNTARVLTALSGAFPLTVEQLQYIIENGIGSHGPLLDAAEQYADAHEMKIIRATEQSRKEAISEIADQAREILTLIERIGTPADRNDVDFWLSNLWTDEIHAERATRLYSRLGQDRRGEILSPRVTGPAIGKGTGHAQFPALPLLREADGPEVTGWWIEQTIDADGTKHNTVVKKFQDGSFSPPPSVAAALAEGQKAQATAGNPSFTSAETPLPPPDVVPTTQTTA